MSEPLAEAAREAALALDAWLRARGWAGHDPYDVRGLPHVIHPRGRAGRALATATVLAERAAPAATRRVLGVAPAVNAKAMGLLAEGYLRLHDATGDPAHRARAEEALAWLTAHPSPGYAGPCWGYPFDWQTRILVPRGTPSSVVTATAGQAFWTAWRRSGDARHLAMLRGICAFLSTDLARDDLGQGRICFSYTPLDRFHVHNANLMVAELLARVGAADGRADWVDLAHRAAAYALAEQRADGSLCYWGRDQSQGCHIDHYHSGFEIRALDGLWRATGEARYRDARDRYAAFYLARLFDGEGRPRFAPERTYPVDVHACAEAILCLGALRADLPAAAARLAQALPWILGHMRRRDGAFIYRIARRPRRRVRIAFLRWGQAWMLRALATLAADPLPGASSAAAAATAEPGR